MKKLVLLIILSCSLVGCSEEKKTDTVEKENKYLKSSIMKELSKIDEINMEKMVSNSIESKGPITLLMLFYTTIGTKMIYCEAIAGINKEMDEKIKEEKTKDLYLKLDDNECKIYTEIYDKYNFMFLNAINTNSTPNYFYFELQYPTESTQESIGIFPTKDECEYYSSLFRSKNIGLTGSCKKGFSNS